MSYCVRLMRREDIEQVTEIDQEAFSEMWPVTNYGHELQNRMAHYLVVYDSNNVVNPDSQSPAKKGLLGLMWLKRLFQNDSKEAPPTSKQYIVGFAGFWMMADESHISSIAVRRQFMHQGIGELLLISSIELSKQMSARLVTLEVRLSNIVAQNLYRKYGFAQVGLRRGYYRDRNGTSEDAVLMTLRDMDSADWLARLEQLKLTLVHKCSVTLSPVPR